MPDQDGYPTKEELDRIRAWDPADGPGLLEFVRSIWWSADWGWSTGKIIERDQATICCHYVSTGGWSGNEEIIEVLRNHRLWWGTHWYSTRRGGHYEFRVQEKKEVS